MMNKDEIEVEKKSKKTNNIIKTVSLLMMLSTFVFLLNAETLINQERHNRGLISAVVVFLMLIFWFSICYLIILVNSKKKR